VLCCHVLLYCFLLAPRIFSASTSSIAYQCVTIASQATSIKPVPCSGCRGRSHGWSRVCFLVPNQSRHSTQ
jgi:hypothetical protein